MFEDEKTETKQVVDAKKGFSLADLKNMYATSQQSAPHQEVILCYSKVPVYIKPLKVKDKKDILRSIETKNDNLLNRTLNEIIEKYVDFRNGKPVKTENLTQKEKEQILVYIRLASSDGKEDIKIVHQCPECQKYTKDIPFSIDNIDIVEFNHEKESVIHICDGKIEIQMGPVTIKDETEIERVAKKTGLKTVSDKQLLTVAALIKSIKGAVELTLEEKLSFIDGLDVGDLKRLTDYVSDYDFGIKLPFEFKCEHCEYSGKEEVNSAVFFMS